MLNDKYYNDLLKKYEDVDDSHKIVALTSKMILSNYNKFVLHFNFPKSTDCFEMLVNNLFDNFSKYIFSNHADITGYSIGDKLKRNREKSKNIYVIIDIKGQDYILTKEKDISSLKITSTFDKLKRNYTQIQQGVKNSTLSSFMKFFETSNEYSFTPTHFAKKLVLIAGKTMLDKLINKNSIPSIYLPNTREGEQTTIKSIPALEDCIAYITPKYEVCREENLNKGKKIDTIIVCDTDLEKIPQIIQDKNQYNFNLIILSNKIGQPKFNGTLFWDWQKEEVELIENKAGNCIEVDCIEDNELDNLIQHFEDCMKYISSLDIKLKSYGYFLRLALNALQNEQFDYLQMRLKNNKELERNEGGYEDFADKNPKAALENLISYLKGQKLKQSKLKDTITNSTKSALIVADRENIAPLKTTKNNKCKIISNAELKKLIKSSEISNKTIVFYSFNGSKDFEFIYNLPNNVRLVLYKQEKELYFGQLQAYAKQLETELTSDDRFAICGIKYEPIIEPEIKVNPTLEQIIERLEQRSNIAYDGYKDENDSLLDDLDEELNYKITFSDNSTIEIESNETVFDAKGNLIKSYRLKIGSKVRIYPKEQLAENLFQIAVEVEPDKFGKIDEHSAFWLNALKTLDKLYLDREILYQKLKESGLKVLPATVDAYFRGNRKFPMYNSDLQAILKLAQKENLLSEIKKSKRLYNSTMIALGRGVKQELQQFLKNKTVGDILTKKNFTVDALQQFINEYMLLLTITKIEEINDGQ